MQWQARLWCRSSRSTPTVNAEWNCKRSPRIQDAMRVVLRHHQLEVGQWYRRDCESVHETPPCDPVVNSPKLIVKAEAKLSPNNNMKIDDVHTRKPKDLSHGSITRTLLYYFMGNIQRTLLDASPQEATHKGAVACRSHATVSNRGTCNSVARRHTVRE